MDKTQQLIDQYIAKQREINRQAKDKALRAKGQIAKQQMLKRQAAAQGAAAKPPGQAARGANDWIVIVIPPGSQAPQVLVVPQSQFEKAFKAKVTPSK